MRFSLFAQALLASLAATAFGDVDTRCDEGPFASNSPTAGRLAGGITCHTQWNNGELITGIEAWAQPWHVAAFRVQTSRGGWGDIRGKIPEGQLPPEQHMRVEWGAHEQVAVNVWNNKHDPMDAVGKIRISKGGQVIFDVGAHPASVAPSENVGSDGGGFILGVKTGSGSWLDYVEFKMLKSKVMKAELVDVQPSDDLNSINEQQKGIEKIDLDTMYFANENPIGGPKMEYSLEREQILHSSQEISSETTNEWAAGVQVTVGGSVGLPLLFEVSTEVSAGFEFRNQEIRGSSMKNEKTDRWSYTFASHPDTPLEPQTAAICKATAASGKYNGPYIGTTEVTLADGSTFKYQDRGDVKTMSWHKGGVNCTTVKLNEVPIGMEKAPTKAIKEKPKGKNSEVDEDTKDPTDNDDTNDENNDDETTENESPDGESTDDESSDNESTDDEPTTDESTKSDPEDTTIPSKETIASEPTEKEPTQISAPSPTVAPANKPTSTNAAAKKPSPAADSRKGSKKGDKKGGKRAITFQA